MPAQVGALRVTLGANTAQFEQGMRRAQATARSTGQSIERSMGGLSARVSQTFAGIRVAAAGLGVALGAGFLVQQARSAFDFAASLGETSRSIGVTVEQLQILQRAAIENGASVEGMERAVAILNRTLGQARAGVPAAVQAFRALRIDPRQFTSAGEVLPRVMESIRGLATQAEQAAAAQRLMGRGAAEMLPFLVQGAAGYDRVATAARAAGLVTEEQARRADEAHDQLEILAYSLRTNLASALDGILPSIQAVIGALTEMGSAARWAMSQIPSAVSTAAGAARNTMMLGPALGTLVNLRQYRDTVLGWMGVHITEASGKTAPTDTGANNLDLSPSGRPRQQSDAAEKRALRDEHQFQQDLRREQIQQLEEQKQRTNDYVEQNNIQVQINALNREQYKSDLDLRVALHDLTQAKEDQLLAAYDATDIERRNTLVASEHADRVREVATVAENEYNLMHQRLQSEQDAAQTAEERRHVGLQLLDLDYQYRRLKLEQIVRETNVYDEATRLDALLQLQGDRLRGIASLSETHQTERSALMRSTRGPLAEYLAGLPDTAAKAREALQGVAVEGLQSITDGLADAITGTRKWGDVFKNVARQILADLIKIQLEQRLMPLLGNALNSLFGGSGPIQSSSWASVVSTVGSLPGRAAGGPVLPGRAYMVGERGPEVLRMGSAGGAIIPHGAGVASGPITIHQTYRFEGVAITQREFVQGLQFAKYDTLQTIQQSRRRAA